MLHLIHRFNSWLSSLHKAHRAQQGLLVNNYYNYAGGFATRETRVVLAWPRCQLKVSETGRQALPGDRPLPGYGLLRTHR